MVYALVYPWVKSHARTKAKRISICLYRSNSSMLQGKWNTALAERSFSAFLMSYRIDGMGSKLQKQEKLPFGQLYTLKKAFQEELSSQLHSFKYGHG